MVMVVQANTSLVGDANTLTVDLMCLIDSINDLKDTKPKIWESIVTEFKRIASESEDGYEYEMMKQFITNLQDLY